MCAVALGAYHVSVAAIVLSFSRLAPSIPPTFASIAGLPSVKTQTMAVATVSTVPRSSPPPRSLLPVMASATSSSADPNPRQSGHGLQLPELRDASLSSLEVVGARRSLLSRFASLQRPYTPFPFLGWNRHVETIFAAFFRSLPRVALRRECLRTRDDGTVALDWVSGDELQLPLNSPVLILLVSFIPFL